MAPGMEGPPKKRRTFREIGLWHGRSPEKTQDLPGKWLLAWKVPLKIAGPSGKMPPSMEGLVVLARLAGLSKPESVDLVQHLKVDLVQPLWPAGLRARPGRIRR